MNANRQVLANRLAADILVKRDISSAKETLAAIRPQDTAVVVNAQVGPGRMSLLHWTARRGDKDMAELLLSHGADPRQRDASGQTPSQYAIRCRHADLGKHLQTLEKANRPASRWLRRAAANVWFALSRG